MEIRLEKANNGLIQKLDIPGSELLYQHLSNPFRFFTTEREALEHSLSGLRTKLANCRECLGKDSTRNSIAQFEERLNECP